MSYTDRVPFSTLRGETLTAIDGMTNGSDVVTFTTESGRTFKMYHEEDCCERVELSDVTGNVDDLLGSPLTMAREDSNSEDDKPSEYAESWTWTFYNLATVKGYVSLRWLGQSNGYYSESVALKETTPGRTTGA